jgi:integrase
MSDLTIKPPEAARHPVHDIAQGHDTKFGPRRFTAVSIGALKPRAQRYEVTDPGCAGLQLTIEPTGCKSWMFRFYWQGKRQRQVLGHCPDLGLARARELAGAAGTLFERGIDPRAAGLVHGSTTRAGEAPSETTDKHSVRFLAHEYMTHYVNPRLQRPDHVQHILNKDVLPRWGGRDARTITSREVVELLDEIVARGARVKANRTAAKISQMFRFGVQRGLLEHSPVQLLYRPGGTEHSRKRALSEDELVAFLQGLPAVCTSRQKAHLLRILLLTAVRRSALGLAAWQEIDFAKREWRIPAEHDKEGRETIIPLSDWAMAEFQALKALAKGSKFVVPNRGHHGPSNPQLITRSVTRLQERFQTIGIEPFTTHDLRRTARTHMAKLGVRREVAERVLNHAVGAVERAYDVHEYLKEKRAALGRWERHLRQLEARPHQGAPAEIVLKNLFGKKLRARRGQCAHRP